MKDILQLGIESGNKLGVYQNTSQPPIRYIHIKEKTMKDILFEKHHNIIFDNVQGDVSQIKYAAVACANTTKEIAKGFAEWISGRFFPFVSTSNEVYYWRENEDEKFTTEQLLEKYLLTLNQ